MPIPLSHAPHSHCSKGSLGCICESLKMSRQRTETQTQITSLTYSEDGGVCKRQQLFLTCPTRHTAVGPAAKLPEVQKLLHVIVKAIFPDCVLILDTGVSHLEEELKCKRRATSNRHEYRLETGHLKMLPRS